MWGCEEFKGQTGSGCSPSDSPDMCLMGRPAAVDQRFLMTCHLQAAWGALPPRFMSHAAAPTGTAQPSPWLHSFFSISGSSPPETFRCFPEIFKPGDEYRCFVRCDGFFVIVVLKLEIDPGEALREESVHRKRWQSPNPIKHASRGVRTASCCRRNG